MKPKVYSPQTRAERDAHVESLLKDQFGRGSPADVIAPEHRILMALAPLARAGVFSGLGEAQVRDAVEAAVRKLRLPAIKAGR